MAKSSEKFTELMTRCADKVYTFAYRLAGNDPAHTASVFSLWNLPRHFELDGTLRYVDNLPGRGIGSYTEMDVRVGWKGIENLDFDVIGQNLLASAHQEFRGANKVERGVYARTTWHF